MKPFELTVYPREVHPVYGLRYLTGVGDPADWWEWTELNAATRSVHAHRLSDAELAAEYWRAQDDVSCADDPSGSKPGTWPNGYDRENGQFLDDARLETLHRFATLPHYDEEVTP